MLTSPDVAEELDHGYESQVAHQIVDNEWFVAEFPSDVAIEELPVDEFAKTTEFTAEVEPFGVFMVRVTRMPIDPSIAVGPGQWSTIYGDNWVKNLARFHPETLDDQIDTRLGGSTRHLVVRIDYCYRAPLLMDVRAA